MRGTLPALPREVGESAGWEAPPRRRDRDPRGALARVLLVALAVLLVSLGVLWIALPGLLRRTIVSRLRHACPQCTVELGRVDVSLRHGVLAFTDAHVASRAGTDVVVEVRADRLELEVEVPSLLVGSLHVRRAVARRPWVVVRETGDGRSSADDDASVRRSLLLALPRMRIDGLTLTDGRVEYVRRAGERAVALRVDDVDGHVGPFGTRAGTSTRGVVLEAQGVLERSGVLALTVQLDPLAPRSDAHIELDLRDQSLDDLNGFLAVASGMRLQGRIGHAHASAVVERGRLEGELSGEYTGLTVRFEPTARTDAVGSTVFSAGSGLPLRGRGDGRAALRAERQRGELLPALVWRAVRAGLETVVRR
jgi:hypothetical protein